jgi:hypothetical protein
MENSFGGCNKAVVDQALVDLVDQEAAVYDELVVVDHTTSAHCNKEDQADQEEEEEAEEEAAAAEEAEEEEAAAAAEEAVVADSP